MIDTIYWLKRAQHALAMAREATTDDARAIHTNLAAEYTLQAGTKAVNAEPATASSDAAVELSEAS